MQQPPSQYQPQPPFMPPPPPSKKPKRWPWIAAIIVALFVGYGIGHSPDPTTTTDNTAQTVVVSQPTTASSTPTATPTPTPKPKPKVWTTTHTFTGNGNKKTAIFSVPDDWKLQWKCDTSSFDGLNYNVIIDVDNPDGSYMDPSAINVICKSGNTNGETEEHQSGKAYLAVDSEGSWTLTIQELK